MLRTLLRVGCQLTSNIHSYPRAPFPLLQKVLTVYQQNVFKFGSLCSTIKQPFPLLALQHINLPTGNSQVRTVTKFSLRKGKRKSVRAVLKRFFRLHWGCWIRTCAGRHKKLWRKSERRRKRLKHHVLTNTTQSYLLDKMVTNYWRKPKYYVDDPYEPYHTREEYPITRRKPV